jgi:tetratricopeptide (TPR) repeat protein
MRIFLREAGSARLLENKALDYRTCALERTSAGRLIVDTRMPLPMTLNDAQRCLKGGDLDQAEHICQRLLKADKRNVNALALLGTIAYRRGRYEQYVAYYRKCLAIHPKHADFHLNVGKGESMLGRYPQSIASLDNVLKIDPDHPEAIGWKAASLERLEEFAAARTVLEPFFADGRQTADMVELMAKLDIHEGRPADAVERIRKQLERQDAAPTSMHALHFQLGRAHEKLQQDDLAFAAFTAANETIGALPGHGFDAQAHVQLIDQIIQTFSADALAAMPRASEVSQLPVFVVGMPRSGTTLVERILDMHPKVHAAGELSEVEQIAHDLQLQLGSLEPFPQCATDLDQATVDKQGRRYLQFIKKLGRSAARVTNKSLEVYKNLGLVSRICPGARIIHVQRDPMDVGLSCYMGGIRPSKAPYVTDLAHLGLVYRHHQRLMDHWRSVLDLPWLDVAYEQIVDDLEGTTRRMIDLLGLPWDERCLRFYESTRPVLTLSYAQVNKPIYKTAKGRWKRYEAHMAPLQQALQG